LNGASAEIPNPDVPETRHISTCAREFLNTRGVSRGNGYLECGIGIACGGTEGLP
jgi:hypothetical protein